MCCVSKRVDCYGLADKAIKNTFTRLFSVIIKWDFIYANNFFFLIQLDVLWLLPEWTWTTYGKKDEQPMYTYKKNSHKIVIIAW